MEVQRLKIQNFRNIRDETLDLDPKLNIFVGGNGEGKTSLLEALYVCSRGKSFRATRHLHLIRHAAESAILEASFKNSSRESQVQIQLNERNRVILHNGKKLSASELFTSLPMILFSPESLQVIKDGPESRRELIDEVLLSVDSNNGRLLSEFERAYKTKVRVLKDHVLGVTDLKRTKELLDALMPSYVRTSVELTVARLNSIRKILLSLQTVFASIFSSENVDISVDYVISDHVGTLWTPEEVFNAINQRQTELLSREIESGQNLVGPHKHEIRFLYNGNDSRFFCSQGQQRAIILAFKISQVRYQLEVLGKSPVLLLDDVFSELDSERRDFLVRFLKNSNAQTVMTTTDLAFCESLRGSSLAEFHVKQGRVICSN